MALRVVPANLANCADLDAIFGKDGVAGLCRCQRYRLARGEAFKDTPVETRAERLRDQTACGDAASPQTTGLVAYLDAEPGGWCAVAPRVAYEGLVRNSNQTAWRGRDEDRSDPHGVPRTRGGGCADRGSGGARPRAWREPPRGVPGHGAGRLR